MVRSFRFYLFLLVALALSFWSIKPILIPGFFPMHDNTQPSRIFEMSKEIKEGQFPVRIVKDLGYGYGYPLFNFYSPLPYYAGSVFFLSGSNILFATKSMFILGIVLSSIFMFFLANKIAGPIAGMAAALLYVYAPYHAVNIYVRGAVAEYYAYAFLPLVLHGLLQIWDAVNGRGNTKKGVISTSLGYAGILLSHNILGLIVSYIVCAALLLIFLISLRKKVVKVFLALAFASLLLGFGISAFFTIPAISEAKFTKVSTLVTGGSVYLDHFVFLDQIWESPWGFAGSAPGRADGMSYKAGKIHIFLGLLAIIILGKELLSGKKTNKDQKYTLISLFLLSISLFFMLDASKFLWSVIPLLSFVQFPWRFLNFFTFGLNLAAVTLFVRSPKNIAIVMSLLIIGSIFILYLKYFNPQTIVNFNESDYISVNSLNTKISGISDEYTPPAFEIPDNKKITSSGIIEDPSVKVIRTIKDLTLDRKVEVDALTRVELDTKLAYFPGWKLTLDGKKEDLRSNKGIIAISIPAGVHSIELQRISTPIEQFANAISILSLFLLVYVSLFFDNTIVWLRSHPWKL